MPLLVVGDAQSSGIPFFFSSSSQDHLLFSRVSILTEIGTYVLRKEEVEERALVPNFFFLCPFSLLGCLFLSPPHLVCVLCVWVCKPRRTLSLFWWLKKKPWQKEGRKRLEMKFLPPSAFPNLLSLSALLLLLLLLLLKRRSHSRHLNRKGERKKERKVVSSSSFHLAIHSNVLPHTAFPAHPTRQPLHYFFF